MSLPCNCMREDRELWR